MHLLRFSSFFFFNDTATTEIYTLSLHDALPICIRASGRAVRRRDHGAQRRPRGPGGTGGRRERDVAGGKRQRAGESVWSGEDTPGNPSPTFFLWRLFLVKKKKRT